MKTKRFLALLMTLCMLTGMLSGMTVSAAPDPITVASTRHNVNQEDGIVVTKTATPKEDGTVDISITAYTTGEVTAHSTVTPTDIVLVLDVSGSMDDEVEESTITGYTEVQGSDQSWDFLWWSDTRYGFASTDTTYYIDKNGTKIPVTYAGEDDNNYDFYTDGSSYYYPVMESGYTNQALSYPIVQFYSATIETTTQSKMEVLKAGAKAFIETTAAKNAGITDASKMHRIAIVKYADDSYYSGTASTQTLTLAEGNNKNSSGYNYTQVVKGLLPVTSANATVLEDAIDSLDAGGATAIDYGMNLASALLGSQESDDRADVIIAFTDGEPNHQNGFDSTVANNALDTAASLKSTGDVSVYTISMAENADASVLGTNQTNQFMHYLSSNYPNAISMSNSGTGDIAKGYYLTPDGDHALESIFTGIMQNIGAPHVEMGANAVLTDAISSYFALKDDANSITLQEVAKTATGWGTPAATTATYSLSADKKVVKVTGFDFDANYLSAEARDGSFYGKALLLTMNVTPQKHIIDAGASVHQGNVPTNAGDAFLADSTGVSRAVVGTPTLTLPKVTYSYTINGTNKTEYATNYRLPGTTETVKDVIERTGYTFEGWTAPDGVTVSAGSYTVPNAHIEFTGNLAPQTFTVTYAYTGTVPTNAPELSTLNLNHTANYTETVTVANPVTAPTGYQFVGWMPLGTDVAIDQDGKFTMPARDVTLVGHFEPEDFTPYAVEHYLQNLDGSTYHLHEVEDKVGTTGATAVAVPKNSYKGFHYDEGNANEILSAKIEGDGSTVLRIYYNRNTYTVSYRIDGAVHPDGVTAPTGQTDVMFGQTVNIAENLDVQDYIFSGWVNDAVASDPNYVEVTAGGTFEMPAANVVISGFFSKQGDVPYTVEHYLQNPDGTTYSDGKGGTDPAKTETFTGETGTPIEAFPVTFTGFTYDEENPNEIRTGNIATGTVLKLYYKRNQHQVTYTYHGVVPENAPTLPGDQTEYYGATVTVAGAVTPPSGYNFHGWRISDSLEEVTSFPMPDHDVVLAGHIHPHDNVRYQIEHYYQDINGDYPEAPQEHEARFGTTDAVATVYAHRNPGFTLDESETVKNIKDETDDSYKAVLDPVADTLTAKIKGDGSTILKFYYNRQSYKVEYQFEGEVPAGVNKTAYVTTEMVPYGEEITLHVIPEAEYQGYSFSGWKTEDVELADGATGFTMPANHVLLKGSFAAELNTYKVRHLLETLDGSGESFDGKHYKLEETETITNKRTGALVEAIPKDYTGFHPSDKNVLTGNVAGDGSLVIDVYYNRNLWTVTYVYYDNEHLPAGAPALPAKMENVPYGKSLTVEDKLSHNGYSFDGWHTHSVHPVANAGKLEYTMPNHDVVFYGSFVQQYNVTYDLNGGTPATGADYEPKVVAPDTVITVEAAPTKSGYTFAGWKATDENFTAVNYTAGQSVTVNHDLHFVAQWKKNSGGTPGGGGGVTRYILTYESNGGTKYDKETYSPGKVVQLDKEPHKEGYVFDGWYADKELTQAVTEVKMTKNITVYAGWVENNGTAGNGHETPGALDGEHHFAYVVGYPDGTVRPNDHIDRAEVTAIFFRLLKEEIRSGNLTDQNPFADVTAEDWFNKAISTMTKLGIVKGRYENAFEPNDFITRAEFAAICARFDDSQYEIVDSFADVAGHWAENEIHEAAAHGWIKGYEDGNFHPDQLITRAEAMTMINRVLNRIPETENDLLADMIIWPDNADTNAWYYLAVQEATNSHNYEMKNHIYESWTGLTENTDWTIYQ